MKPAPKFQTSYFFEEKDKDGKVIKRQRIFGQRVGLFANRNCGTIDQAFWSERFDQWAYSIYPWSNGESNKLATEDMIQTIEKWLVNKIDIEVHRAIINIHYTKNMDPIATRIITLYNSVYSARATNQQEAINNLNRVVKDYVHV